MPIFKLKNQIIPSNTVLILGAGLSGAFAALEAAKKNYRVFLVDQSEMIIPDDSSSYNECYKLHTGLHYAGDPRTALRCLEDSVAFARAIPAWCLAGSDQLGSPSRRGRHFVMSNSLFSAESVKKVALTLQNRYEELVLQDDKNKVFGEPKNFMTFLSESDYPYVKKNIVFTDMNSEYHNVKVALGIETGESQIDIDKLRTYLTEKIKDNPNITFIPKTKVLNLSCLPDQLGYAVTVKGIDGIETWNVPAIINCTWQNIENFSKQLGCYTPDENRVIGVKMCLRVKLPKLLHNINTCIFSIGPFVSITNLGNGEAVLASEATTNIGYYKAGHNHNLSLLTELARTSFSHQEEIGAALADKIISECSHYVPELKHSKIVKLIIGHVKMVKIETVYDGRSSLYKKNSPIHQRLEHGVEVDSGALCYIANSGNKMTHTAHNAKEACYILKRHFYLRNQLNTLFKKIEPMVIAELKNIAEIQPKPIVNSILYSVNKNAFMSHRSTSYEEREFKDIISSVKRKMLVQSHIKNNFIGKSMLKTSTVVSTKKSRLRSKL